MADDIFLDEQESLFTDRDLIDGLFVVKQGKKVNMTIKQIFDSSLYNEFYGITYVSSPSIFEDLLSEFTKIEFIIGIDDEEQRQAFFLTNAEGLHEQTSFWNKLSDRNKEKVVSGNLKIRFPNNDIIHDKIYLLRNTQTGDVRVVRGSANFTKTALNIHRKQFEHLEITDNDKECFDLWYKERFRFLFDKHTVDYIPEKYKKEFMKGRVRILPVTDEETVQNEIDLITNNAIFIEQNEIPTLKGVDSKVKSIKARAEQINNVVSSIMTSDPSNRGIFITRKKDLINKEQLIKKMVHKYSVYFNENDKLMWDYNGLPELVGVEQEISNIKHDIETIHAYLDCYEKHSEKNKMERLKKNMANIYEIILYTFTSFYLTTFREMKKSLAEKNIPVILIVGGQSNSGKSEVLKFVKLLIGDKRETLPNFATDIGKTACKTFENIFQRDNEVFPYIVDEVPTDVFKKENWEISIKNISGNTLHRTHCFIGNTNLDAFSAKEQVLTRMYYLILDNSFTTDKKHGAVKEIHAIQKQVTPSLFREFIYRMEKHLEEGKEFDVVGDFLKVGREILRSIYEDCQLPTPEYFPVYNPNEHYNRGREFWRDTYRRLIKENPAAEDAKNNTITFDTSKYQFIKQINLFEDSLPSNIIRSKFSSMNIIVHRNLFIDYIGGKESRFSKKVKF